MSNQLARIALFREWSFGRSHPLRMPQKPDLPNDFLMEDAQNLGLVLNQLMREYDVRDQVVKALQSFYEGVHDYHVDIQYGTVQTFLREGKMSIPASRLSAPQDDGGYQSDLYTEPAGSDDERGEMTDDDADAEDRAQTESLTTASESGSTVQGRVAETWAREFRDAISCSLELLGADPLAQGHDESGNATWQFPPLDQRAATDPTWTATLDTLRVPRKTDQKLAEWRRDAPIRPVTFEAAKTLTEDTVHLHLEQRVAQRLFARFRSQGFIHHDLSRACLAQTKDSTPRVVLLGRLSLYGNRAERLHEEVIPVAARWIEPDRRRRPLQAYARAQRVDPVGLVYLWPETN